MPPFRYFAVSLYAAGVLCVTTTAFAAQPQPVYNWTGWYIGLNAGGNWGSSKTSTTFDPGPNQFPIIISYDATALATINPVGAPSRFDTSGFTGGIHGGYNWQSGNFLAGGEIDFDYFRSAGSQTRTGPYVAGGSVSITSSLSTDWLFTARPRLGYVYNNWLVYATGGVAVTQLKGSWSYLENFNNIVESASVSSTKAGWVAGGGIESGLSGGVTLGVEYLYVSFGDVSPPTSFPAFAGGGALSNPVHHSLDLQANIVRARLTQRF